MLEEEQDGHDERGGLVVAAAARDLAEFDVLDRDRRDEREHLVGADACGRCPVLDCDQLDGAGDDGPEPLIGFTSPLEPLRVDDQHVDVSVADGLLARRDTRNGARVPGCRRSRSAFRMARGSSVGMEPVIPMSFVPPLLLEHGRQDDHADDDNDHHDQ